MQADAGTSGRARSVDLREDIPHSARMYDYYLGGKDNYAADREAAEQALAVFPHLRTYASQNRAFLHRAVRYLAADAGVRQFVDVGTGIPTSPNLHEIAQRVAPDARIVYVDNDPIVLVHARALLTGTPQGRTAYVDADLRRPDEMIAVPEFAATLDPARPIALSLIAILHFFPDADRPADIVARLCERLPAGSFLVVSHGTAELAPQGRGAGRRGLQQPRHPVPDPRPRRAHRPAARRVGAGRARRRGAAPLAPRARQRPRSHLRRRHQRLRPDRPQAVARSQSRPRPRGGLPELRRARPPRA